MLTYHLLVVVDVVAHVVHKLLYRLGQCVVLLCPRYPRGVDRLWAHTIVDWRIAL